MSPPPPPPPPPPLQPHYRVFHYEGMEGNSPFVHQSKNNQIAPSGVSSHPTKFLFLPSKSPKVTRNGASKSKKKVINILNNKIGSIFKVILKKCSVCGTHFYKNWQFMTMKACHSWKTCSLPPPKFWKFNPMGWLSSYWPDLNGKPCIRVPADGFKGGVSTRSFCEQ